MKKLFPKILIAVCILALVLVVAVACNQRKGESVQPEDGGEQEYEVATYTVTFVSNGTIDFSVFNLRDVEAGTRIYAPKNSDGTPAIPTKTGYTFAYWSSDGSTEFDFVTERVNSDLTLTAVYLPNEYVHTADITAKLVQEEDSQGNKTYRIETGVYEGGAMPAGAELKSTYNSNVGAFAVPTTSDAADRFLFWYYINDAGKPVQFTNAAAQSSESVQTVTQLVSYKFTKPLTLYAMWYSLQSKVKVVYNDSLSDEKYGEQEYFQSDYVLDTDAPNMSEKKEGYLFDKWYYKKTTGDKEEKVDFVFDTLTPSSNPTSITTAAGIDSVFESGTLNLYAEWKPIVSIASIADFETKLYGVLHGESATEEEKQTLLKSVIKVAGTIDFGTTEYEPLFDAEHVFVGEIDGGLYDDEGNLTGKAKLTGGAFGDGVSASVFGHIGGTVKNLDFENIGLKFAVPKKDGTTFTAGAIASESSAKIENCEVIFNILSVDIDGAAVESGYLTNGLASVVFGGAVARNVGGEIKNCVVSISADALLENLIFGGVAGKNESAGKIEGASVVLSISSVKCIDNNKAADGLPSLKVGGVVGVNGGLVTKSSANVSVAEAESKNGFELGGITASSTGGVTLSEASVNLATAAAPAIVGVYANVGGLVGKSEGYLQSSFANVQIYVEGQTAGDELAVGGLVGNNYSAKTDYSTGDKAIGTIIQSYSTGDISVVGTDATVYAAGIAGRNNKSNINADFAATNVSVENAVANNLGKLFGTMGGAQLKSAWYANESTLTLGGEAAEGLVVGTGTARANFESAEFVIGTSSTIKFDNTIWQITSGLPEHKPFE